MGLHYLVNESLFYEDNPFVNRNLFLHRAADLTPLPVYEEIRGQLPRPIWEGHDDALACYDKAWQLAFANLRQPNAAAGFVSPFIDTAFNGYLFLWDSSFIVLFGRYASHIFDFQQTLDNFYSHQHRDGFICREICESAPGEQFHRDDPASTGPNILAWSEWEHFLITGDRRRLEAVFYPLLAYHRWLQRNRTWRDGSYWSCGLACGMDNQPRTPQDWSPMVSHGHAVWLDACVQMLLSANLLTQMGRLLGHEEDTLWLQEERERLPRLINEKMWSEQDAFYYDLWEGDVLSGVKSIGAYWTLLAGLVPEERLPRFLAHLENPAEFARPNPVPSLSADHPAYRADGGYWLGGVWAPTNYMLLKGLDSTGHNALAHRIACRYLKNVTEVFRRTGTLWENYAPEAAAPGDPAKPDFVGWTGLAPICMLIEYVLGLRADARRGVLLWDVRRTERHGVQRYPFGGSLIDLVCEARPDVHTPPVVHVKSPIALTLELRWEGGSRQLTVVPTP